MTELTNFNNVELAEIDRFHAKAKEGRHQLQSEELEALRAECDQLRSELDGVRRAARNISAINGELLAKSGKVYSREQNLDAQVEGVQAANALLTEENDQLRARVLDLETSLVELDLTWTEKHDARVTELLEANNREVERRRRVEALLEACASVYAGWFDKNSDAMQALVEGRAAVVPLHFGNVGMNYIVYGGCNSLPLWDVRLDKPVENNND